MSFLRSAFDLFRRLPPKVGLVKLHRAVKRLVVFLAGPCLAHAHHHEPGRFLADAKVAVQLHPRNGLLVRDAEVDTNCPLTHPEVGSLHGRDPVLHAEIGPAILAVVRHQLAALDNAGTFASALAADALAVRPDAVLEPLGCDLVRGEHIHHFNEGHAFAVESSGGWLRHCGFRLLLPTI